ncbi:hypothetical protein N7489_002686, partial [Penicillium chrysogenum]
LVCLPSLVPDNLWPWWNAILAFPGPGILVTVRGFRWILWVSAFLVVAYFICEMFSRIQVMRYKPARQLHRQSGILPEWGGEHAPRFLGTLPPISNCLASEHNPTKMYSNRNLPTWYQCLHRLSSPQHRTSSAPDSQSQSLRSIRISHVNEESSITGFVPSSSRQQHKPRSSKKPLRVLAQ